MKKSLKMSERKNTHERNIMEFIKSRSWRYIRAAYWTLVFAAAAFGYWLIISTLF